MSKNAQKTAWILVIVAALGYFVDVFDILLFAVIRTTSLKGIGVPDAELLNVGVRIINSQLIGMLVGGILCGVLGDKKGRLSVLFGSILLYSTANFFNAYVTTVDQYVWLRFIAGVGLAGELGAGVTLVTETLPQNLRGIGTMIISTVGVAGGLVAALVGKLMPWSTAYIIAGCMGLALLFLRFSVRESELFKKHSSHPSRGNLLHLFSSGARTKKFFASVLSGVPIYFVLAIVVTFAPEIGAAKGLGKSLTAGDAIFYSYVGFIAGDMLSGLISQWAKSRKTALYLFIFLNAIVCYLFLGSRSMTLDLAHWYYLVIGTFSGYWAVIVTVGAEQFGTNLRATTSTIIPNLIRASVVPINLLMKQYIPEIGIISVCLITLVFVSILALMATTQLDETFSKHMDFVES